MGERSAPGPGGGRGGVAKGNRNFVNAVWFVAKIGIGRSRGGFGTKLHLAVGALGNPVVL